jgi:ankyrin repeat protein
LNSDESGYPHALEKGFPRIVENIIELWNTPSMPTYFYELMVDVRGGARQGFPPPVALDIFNLHKIYSAQFPDTTTDDHTNVWGHVSENKKHELAELGFAYSKEDFLKAIETGNQEAITVFMSCGVDMESRDERDWTPLMISSFNGNEKLAIFLIRCGAKVQAQDQNGYTPLHWSAFNGYEKVVELLLEKSAQVNARSQFGWTALMQAATRGHIKVVKKLLKSGAWVNETTADGWTALHKAAANGHTEIVLQLLEKGADKSIAYPDGSTALSLAEKNKHIDIARILNSNRVKHIG